MLVIISASITATLLGNTNIDVPNISLPVPVNMSLAIYPKNIENSANTAKDIITTVLASCAPLYELTVAFGFEKNTKIINLNE